MFSIWIVLLLLVVSTKASVWSISMSRMMMERKMNQMRRTKMRVAMRKRATMVVKVRSDSCSGIESQFFVI